MQPDDEVLRLCSVAFSWGDASAFRMAIDSFAVRRCESLLIMGPSGSGKSTLLSLACGIVSPERGSITVAGTTITGLRGAALDRFRAEHFGIIFQMFNLPPYGSIVDNVLLPLHVARERRSRASRDGNPVEEARRLLVRLGLDPALHRRASPTLGVGQVRKLRLRPTAVTAAMIGVTSKIDTFTLQRFVNEYREEPLTAILPGVALQELWSLVGVAKTALSVVSAMVPLTALLGMVTMILTTLNERRREMAILRSVGARPRTVFGLPVSEAGLLTVAGVLLGTGLLYLLMVALRPVIDARFGLHLPIEAPGSGEAIPLVAIVAAGCLAGLLPAWRAYRRSLADGMTIRSPHPSGARTSPDCRRPLSSPQAAIRCTTRAWPAGRSCARPGSRCSTATTPTRFTCSGRTARVSRPPSRPTWRPAPRFGALSEASSVLIPKFVPL